MNLFVRVDVFSLQTIKVRTPCFSMKKSAVKKFNWIDWKKKFAAAWVKIFFLTRISGNKGISFFGFSITFRDAIMIVSNTLFNFIYDILIHVLFFTHMFLWVKVVILALFGHSYCLLGFTPSLCLLVQAIPPLKF